MISADVTPWYRERLLEAGAADYLTKPLDVPRFLEVVNGLLVAATR
jgi:DNA-binding response OmpR family regulator